MQSIQSLARGLGTGTEGRELESIPCLQTYSHSGTGLGGTVIITLQWSNMVNQAGLKPDQPGTELELQQGWSVAITLDGLADLANKYRAAAMPRIGN
jgi:hypothetical protein